MKISLNWLTDYVDVSMPVKELAELLTRIGLNCEEVIETASDVVLDLEVTSNRPDCLGYLGVAREIAAATGKQLKRPKIPKLPTAEKVEDLAGVEVEAPDLCPRYTARVIRGVKIGPSPAWLIERLESAGLRGINNVVDVTNHVLLEYSQPLHVFDYAKLAGQKIIVRRAIGGETMVSIDQTRCKLDESMLVIADGEKAVAIAGVMGGLDTEVGESTTDVLIESAQFDPLVTRHTSRKLAMMSESNYRFERGVDPVGVDEASLRACQMIIDLAGGKMAEGVIDVWVEEFKPQKVTMRPERCNALLGISVKPERQADILEGLGLEPKMKDGKIVCTIPSWRADLQREVDLIEEVARIEGYDKIPVSGEVSHAVTDEGPVQKLRRRIGQLLTAAGFDEAITYTFTDSNEAELFGFDKTINVDPLVRKSNNALCPTLLSGLLRTCKANQDAGNAAVNLFELANVFRSAKGNMPDEQVELTLVTTGDLQDLRGVIEVLVQRLTPAVDLDIRPAAVVALAEGESAEIFLADKRVGIIGCINQQVQDYYGLERCISVATMNFAELLEHSSFQRTYQPLPRFPSVSRDLSLVVDEALTWQQLQEAILSLDQPLRVNLEYVATYRGEQIPEGAKSVTARLVYRSGSGTLRSEEVDEQVGQVVSAMKEKFSAKLRV